MIMIISITISKPKKKQPVLHNAHFHDNHGSTLPCSSSKWFTAVRIFSRLSPFEIVQTRQTHCPRLALACPARWLVRASPLTARNLRLELDRSRWLIGIRIAERQHLRSRWTPADHTPRGSISARPNDEVMQDPRRVAVRTNLLRLPCLTLATNRCLGGLLLKTSQTGYGSLVIERLARASQRHSPLSE